MLLNFFLFCPKDQLDQKLGFHDRSKSKYSRRQFQASSSIRQDRVTFPVQYSSGINQWFSVCTSFYLVIYRFYRPLLHILPLKIVISCLICIDSSVCRLRVERSKRVFGSLIGIKCWFGVYRLYEVGGYSSFDDTLNLFCFRIWSIHSIVNRSIYTATAGAVHGTHGTTLPVR